MQPGGNVGMDAHQSKNSAPPHADRRPHHRLWCHLDQCAWNATTRRGRASRIQAWHSGTATCPAISTIVLEVPKRCAIENRHRWKPRFGFRQIIGSPCAHALLVSAGHHRLRDEKGRGFASNQTDPLPSTAGRTSNPAINGRTGKASQGDVREPASAADTFSLDAGTAHRTVERRPIPEPRRWRTPPDQMPCSRSIVLGIAGPAVAPRHVVEEEEPPPQAFGKHWRCLSSPLISHQTDPLRAVATRPLNDRRDRWMI